MAQEISTGVFFPSALAQDAHLKLVGVGVRKKLVFHVYAFGLYLDTKVIYKALKPTYAHHPVEQLNGDGKFWDALLNEDADKGLVLVMHRKISGDLLNEAFNVSLMERIQSIGLTEAGSKAETGSKAAKLKDEVEPLVALGSFKKFFAERNLKAGSKLTFHCGRGTFMQATGSDCAHGINFFSLRVSFNRTLALLILTMLFYIIAHSLGGVLTAFIDGEEVGKIGTNKSSASSHV